MAKRVYYVQYVHVLVQANIITAYCENKYLYGAFMQRLVSKRSNMDHTVSPANYTMPAFPSYAFTRWRLH